MEYKEFIEKTEKAKKSEWYKNHIENMKKVLSDISFLFNYKDKENKLKEAILGRNDLKYEYGKGGDIHRGYYCPSPIHEHVIGNCKRGIRTKKFPEYKNNIIRREYIFADNKLLMVKTFYSEDIVNSHNEYLLYYDNNVFSICFDNAGNLSCYTRCIYNENYKIIRYDFINMNNFNNYIQITSEIYSYDSKGLSNAKLLSFFHPNHFSMDEYDFIRNEKGEIYKYYGGFLIDENTKNMGAYKIYKKLNA